MFDPGPYFAILALLPHLLPEQQSNGETKVLLAGVLVGGGLVAGGG